MKGRAAKHIRRVTALALLCLLALSISGCAPQAANAPRPGAGAVACTNDEFSAYPEVLSQIMPGYAIERADSYPFRHLRGGHVTEAFGPQAASALEIGIASHWYPQYLATVVIAVDRDLTDARVNSWSDLPAAGEPVGFFGISQLSYETLMAAMAYGLEGADYSLKSAARLLAALRAQGRLVQNSYETPLLICYDYAAAELMKRGRNMEIIVPAEGTLSFEKGLLSTRALEFSANAEALLLSSGLRLLDGRCDAGYYPGPEAYANARSVPDIAHFNAVSFDATRIMRREVFRVRLYSSADGREHQYWVLLYIMLVAVWVLSIVNRAVQRGVRRAALYTGAILIGWIIARLISYQLENVGLFNLTFWYSYYIFQLSLPLVILWLAWIIDKPEGGTPLPLWMRALHLANAILILLVLTNNFHHLVFIPNMTAPRWGTSYIYTYGFVFYIVQAGCWAPLAAGVVVLLRKGRHGLRKKGLLFVFALLFLLAAYAIAYVLRVPIAWESDLTMTVGVFILLLFEACIRGGIIPVNSKYAKLFAHSPLAMQITDRNGAVALRSSHAQQPNDENTLLFSGEITGGAVHWREDITQIVRLHREIEASVKKLEVANAVLVKEEAIRRAVSEETARTQLMKQLEDEIAGHIARLNAMMERREAPARVTLLLAYIKRRSNLFFHEREADNFLAGELAVYMDELSEIAGYAGVGLIFTCELGGGLPVRRATTLYDFFYQVLDWAAGQTDMRILAHLGRENGAVVLRMLPSANARAFRPGGALRAAIIAQGGAFAIKELDDDATGVSLSFPEHEGGEAGG